MSCLVSVWIRHIHYDNPVHMLGELGLVKTKDVLGVWVNHDDTIELDNLHLTIEPL